VIIREPIIAGRFYPADAEECRAALTELLRGEKIAAVGDARGGLVPHAGWMFSGSVTARVFRALAAESSPEVVVLFGGVHHYRGRQAAMFTSGRWETPIGGIMVDDRFAERLLGHTNLIAADNFAHEEEHSIEVQVPFVKFVFPKAKIVPIMVPATSSADEVGDAVARTISSYGYSAVILGTTDLTHYGPDYGFTPKGIGMKANEWAKDVNDRRFIEQVCMMRGCSVVAEAAEHQNACSGGAVAATIAAAGALGATKGMLLSHTTSCEVMRSKNMTDIENSVGYAGVVFV
jgi:MEMO1 family protein